MLNWRQRGKESQDVGSLIARKQYGKAIELLEGELRAQPTSVHLRQMLADALARAGEGRRAVDLLRALVEEFAAEGFAGKAIAVLKKAQRIDPTAARVDGRLAALLQRREAPGGAGAVDRPDAEPATPPKQVPAGPPEPPHPATTEIQVSEAWVEATARRDDGMGLSPLLADLSPGELAAMVGGLKLITKGPGSIILSEGEPGDSLFVLATGVARVYRRDPAGHNFQVATLRDGDFFGEAALLTGQARTATITAATECELLVLDRAAFDALSAAYPRVRLLVEEFHAQRSSRPSGPSG